MASLMAGPHCRRDRQLVQCWASGRPRRACG